MRSSTLVAFTVLASAVPSFAAPVAAPFLARAPLPDSTATTSGSAGSSASNLTPEQSAALSLGTLGTIISVAGPLVGDLIHHFKNNGNSTQRRDAIELEQLVARASDESGAFGLNDAAAVGSILSSVTSIGSTIYQDWKNRKQRDVVELLARDTTTTTLTPEQSAALSLSTLGTIASVGGTVISGIIDHFKNKGNQQQQRDALALESLLARAYEDDDSAALSFLNLDKTYYPTLGTFHSVRDAQDNESGAISFGNVLEKIAGFILRREDIDMFAREDMELLARAVEDDESGAISFGNVLEKIAGFILRREETEMLARDADGESGAISFGNVLEKIAGFILRRDGMDMLTREDMSLLARAVGDDSGAISFGNVLEKIAGFILRRDELQMLAREDDESGAISFGNVLEKIAGFILRREEEMDMFSREELELLARTVEDDESGAISFGNVLEKIAGFILRREEMGMLARDADESGAISFGNVLEKIAGFILRRDGMDMLSREDMDLLARAVGDESGALRLLNLIPVNNYPIIGVTPVIKQAETRSINDLD